MKARPVVGHLNASVLPRFRRATYTPGMTRALVLSLATLLVACATTVGANDPTTLPPNAVEECTTQCESLDLEFDAVAIGDRSVDCICEPD